MCRFAVPLFLFNGCNRYGLLLPSVDDTLEISALQRSATDQATVDVRLREELRSVACLAATTIKDRSLLSSLLAILLSYDRTDVSKHLLSLVRGSSLACTDSPDWLISDDDVLPSLSVEVEYRAYELSLNNLVLLLSLALLESLTAAEENLQAVSKSEVYLLLQDLSCLAVVLTTL